MFDKKREIMHQLVLVCINVCTYSELYVAGSKTKIYSGCSLQDVNIFDFNDLKKFFASFLLLHGY